VPAIANTQAVSNAELNQFPEWEHLLLMALRAPVTKTNLLALDYWAQSEEPGGISPDFNPLNYGQSSTKRNAYNSYKPFVNAVANQLLIGDYGYDKIVAALRNPNSTLEDIWKAINQSSWCRGCQGGRYPTALFSAAKIPVSDQSYATSEVNPNGTSKIPGSTPTDNTFNQCRGSLISWPDYLGGGSIFSESEAKAVVGGFLVMTGVLIMAGGITIVIKNADDRFDIKSLASLVNRPAKAANNGLSNLFNRVGNRRNQKDQQTATRSSTVPPDVLEARREWERKNGRPWSQSPAGKAAAARRKAQASQ